MKHSLLLTIAATLLGLTLAGCTDDIPLNLNGQSQFDEGELVEAALAVNVTTFSVSNTRADDEEGPDAGEEDTSETEEPMTDFEKRVDDIWVFQYGTDGNLLIRPRYYTAEASETDGTWSVLLKASVASKIYVVANAGNETWASAYNDFATDAQLLKQTLPSPFPVIPGSTEDSAIPMEGVNDGENNEGVTVSPEQTEPVVVPVTRMYAKIKVKVKIDKVLLEENEASVYNVTLSSIPWYCQVGTLYDATNMSTPATYPDATYWITRSINEKNDSDEGDQEEGYDYVIYIPENIQGVSVEVTGGSGESGGDDADDSNKDTKTMNAPTNATQLTVRISYIDYTDEEDKESSGVRSFADYTVCPGGNSVDNYNIRRNCVYRVTLNIGYPIDLSYQPSANCIYAAPGSTVYFEPYYRTEEGGGYKFSDYLDPDVEGKQIKGVKILWQTEDCIGDNSSGNLVYFQPLSGSIESQSLHDRIYVTVNQPGNAVIAAYDADPDAEGANIIWSWHIWVPNATEPDPTNEANGKLFTTYYWDSEQIYGYKDANGNVTSNNRTPGYTIMDLNLGALTSVPTSTTFPETYGLLYQFGRKDPFPCARYSMRGEGYADSITGPIYDDAYKQVKLTSADVNDLGDEDYLFYSISGMTSQANPSDYGIAYAIKHPTVFLCGTDSVNRTASITNTSRYVFNGNWTYEETDNLWGATPVEETTKVYYVGQDKSNHDRHLYDDYGEEKSIFDPCPYGWRVSPPDLWLSFTDTGLNPHASLDEVNGTYRSGCYGFDLYLQAWRSGESSFFPMQGPRTPDGCIRNSRICGNYMNATSDTDNRVNILHIHNAVASFCIFEMINPQYYFKSTGGSVRCVRETK